MYKSIRVRPARILAVLPVITSLVGLAMSPAPALAETVTVGFTGKVTAVNATGNSFSAEVRAVYAGGGSSGIGAILPQGKIVQVVVPAGTVMVNVRGVPVTLDTVQVGVLFNANGKFDTATKTMTASKITFGTRVLAPPTPPPSTPPPSTPPSTTTPPSNTPPPSTPPATPPQKGTVNFAGRMVSVDATTRVVVATVRAAYGVSASGIRGGLILPPGTQITLTVPAGIPITRLGVPITLADVKAGDLFNARATIDHAAKTGVASSIQVLTPKIAENIFSGTLTAFSATDSKSVTVKNQAGTEQTFSVTPTTQVYIGKTLGTMDKLVVGRSVAVAFVATAETKQAVKIVMATEQLQVRVDKFFSVNAVQRRGTHMVNILGASLDRFDKIIAKQEASLNSLKAAGKDTTAAEASLAQSKSDLATARSAKDTASAKFAAISSSPDPQAAAKEAQAAMRTAVDATKKVMQDVKNTQRQINLISS